MLMTTPFLRPDDGTVPWPMIVSRPSRLTSPMSAQTLLVPTSMPTRTASRSTVSVVSVPCPAYRKWRRMSATLSKIRRPKVISATRYRSRLEPIADERQEDRDDRVDEEPADEDPIVVDPVELGPDRPEDRIERGEDRHGRVAAELEADVDVEDEAGEDAHEEPEQG